MRAMPYKDALGRTYGYGEFFPPKLSPYAYNETAQEFFSLGKGEARRQGYAWREEDKKQHQATVEAVDLPGSGADIPEGILEEIVGCAHKGLCEDQCTVAFRIIPQELQFYRRMKLPLPQFCPNCRHARRIEWRNPLKLWKRVCQCNGVAAENKAYPNTANHFHGTGHCPNGFKTSYAPERPEIVYCEQCYQAEVA